MIASSRKSWKMSSASICTLPTTRSYGQLTKNVRSKRWIAPSLACPGKRGVWDHDPRLQAAWNHYSVCRHEHPRRQRDRRLHAHPQSLRLDSVSQTHCPPHAAAKATPSDQGQLRGPQGPRGADVAGPPQALSRALRPYQFFLAEHARTLLSRSDGEAHPAWRLS